MTCVPSPTPSRPGTEPPSCRPSPGGASCQGSHLVGGAECNPALPAQTSRLRWIVPGAVVVGVVGAGLMRFALFEGGRRATRGASRQSDADCHCHQNTCQPPTHAIHPRTSANRVVPPRCR
jgi:hypothetical protein